MVDIGVVVLAGDDQHGGIDVAKQMVDRLQVIAEEGESESLARHRIE